MKITKSKLKQLIVETLKEQYDDEEFSEGKFVEITISDDGYDKDIEVVEEADFNPTRSGYTSAKFLAKIVKVAQPKYEDD
tara:strand:- start:336 stop:575 length:240 start_codon:yes stop_codon:yes gene_type:complete